MPLFICRTCSVQFPESATPPDHCPICTDERQYVPAAGQAWTTLDALCRGHANSFRLLEPGLMAIRSLPAVGIDQRALLVMTPAGNILWDCIALLDDATEAIIRALGGLKAIALSHPHYYATMVEWGLRFDVPVHVHAADRAHAPRRDACLDFWEGEEKPVIPGVTLYRLGGHFAGGVVAHWAGGAGGRGALLSGDILQVLPDRKFIGFMRSYPCLIPLPAAEVERMAARVRRLPFEAIYGAFHDREITRDAQGAVARSAARYRAWTERMVEP
jgi:hypothetical protein